MRRRQDVGIAESVDEAPPPSAVFTSSPAPTGPERPLTTNSSTNHEPQSSRRMWKSELYDVRSYNVPAFSSSDDDLLTFPVAREQIEYDFSLWKWDYHSWYKAQITENMLTNGVHQVSDPLIRAALLLRSGELADVSFVVGERNGIRFDVHKFYLVTSSPVFQTMFYGRLPERDVIYLPDVAPEAFQITMEYIYCGLIPKALSAQVGILTLYVARKYLMARFEEIIVGILTELISPSDAFLLLEASYFYELPEVTAKCRAYIDQNIQQLIKTPEFFEIDTSTMIRVLESDNLQIAEIDLFKDGLLKWGAHHSAMLNTDWAELERVRMLPCFKYIRFPTMTATEFANGPAKYLTKDEVATVFMYICTTGPMKPFCSFNTKPRNYVRPIEKAVGPEPCECQSKPLKCFFCCKNLNERFGFTMRGSGSSSTPRGRPGWSHRVQTTATPVCYCPCRTRGSCPVIDRARNEAGNTSTLCSNNGIMEVSPPPLSRRPVRQAAVLRPRVSPRAGWRI